MFKDPVQKYSSRTRDKLKFYRLSEATFYDRINTLYQFIKPFLDNKLSIFLRMFFITDNDQS